MNSTSARTTTAALCVASLWACGETVTEPPPDPQTGVVELRPDKDNTLFEDPVGALSNGAGEFLFAGMTSQPLLRRALIHFDLAGSAIPTGARVDSVTLRVNMSRTNSGPSTMSLHRVTADWGEGASVAPGPQGTGTNAASGDATWIHRFFDTSLWTTPGGDFVATASATIGVELVGSYTIRGATLQSDVEGWIADPSSNFGWVLLGDESTITSAKRFDSREHDNVANRPLLAVYYTRS